MSAFSQYGVVVNKSLYDGNANVRTAIVDYVNVVTRVEGKSVWVAPYTFDCNNFTQDPQALRTVLQNHYKTDAKKLEGVVLIGDMPWILLPGGGSGSYPSDHYFMDMDGTWSKWTSATATIASTNPALTATREIWVSRIASHKLTILRDENSKVLNEGEVVSRYLDKVVRRMTQPAITPNDVAVFASNEADLNFPNQHWQDWWLNPDALAYPDKTKKVYTWNTDAEYVNQDIPGIWTYELQKGHNMVLSYAHSQLQLHHITSTTYAAMMPQSKVHFFLINGCVTGRYISDNCIAGLYALGQEGLVAVAPTTDVALNVYNFTGYLGQGYTFGQAYLLADMGAHQVMFGAGNLKLQPYVKQNDPFVKFDETQLNHEIGYGTNFDYRGPFNGWASDKGQTGFFQYGPYQTLPAGMKLVILNNLRCLRNGNVIFDVNNAALQNPAASQPLRDNSQALCFEVPTPADPYEYRIYVGPNSTNYVRIDGIWEKAYNSTAVVRNAPVNVFDCGTTVLDPANDANAGKTGLFYKQSYKSENITHTIGHRDADGSWYGVCNSRGTPNDPSGWLQDGPQKALKLLNGTKYYAGFKLMSNAVTVDGSDTKIATLSVVGYANGAWKTLGTRDIYMKDFAYSWTKQIFCVPISWPDGAINVTGLDLGVYFVNSAAIGFSQLWIYDTYLLGIGATK
jgi:hypothetical protein